MSIRLDPIILKDRIKNKSYEFSLHSSPLLFHKHPEMILIEVIRY